MPRRFGAPVAPGAWDLFFIAAIVVGAALRCAWLSDMEYKGDERWTFDRTQRIPALEPWPSVGMMSSVGMVNPGLSVWAFVALAKAFAVRSPLGLAAAVVSCNVAAFAILYAFVVRGVAREEREPWLWGLALAAVNPVALVLERKIWTPCLFPIFSVAFLVGWLRRSTRWGAASWGLVGALLGQIQMSGFFYAAAFAFAELTVGRVRAARPKTRWLAWLIGTALGALPMLPWVPVAWAQRGRAPPVALARVLDLRWLRGWVSDTLGLSLDYSLGPDYADFLRHPLFWTGDLYPALYLQGASFAIGAYVVACSVGAWLAVRPSSTRLLSALRRVREAQFTAAVAFGGFGLLMTAAVRVIYRHYNAVTFPLEWVALALLALAYAPSPRQWLACLWGVQLALSLTFLAYIHEHHGAAGDYGRAFHWQ